MITNSRRSAALPLCALALAGALAVAPARAERLTVPLSDPERPAALRVSLLAGSIRVEGYAGKDVIVETGDLEGDEAGAAGMRRLGGHGPADSAMAQAISEGVASATGERDEDSDRDKAKGLKRLPNRSRGLSVEEEKNEVRVDASSWRNPVDLRIKVPAGSKLALTTVNDGDIVVNGVSGEMELQNTNGSIEVQGASNTVVANTVNGEIKVVFTRLAAAKAMAFSSFNGDVDVTLPASLAANVRLSSENGDIYTDFDVQMDSRPPVVKEESRGGRHRVAVEKEMRGRIGAGGPEILFKTFNGDIYIRKAK